MKIAIMSIFSIVITSSGILRIIAVSASIVAFFVLLGGFCLKLFTYISSLTFDFTSDVAGDWFQFVGYVCNFSLIYWIATFYYMVFCTLLISFVVSYILDIGYKIFLHAIFVFRSGLNLLTGD